MDFRSTQPKNLSESQITQITRIGDWNALTDDGGIEETKLWI